MARNINHRSTFGAAEKAGAVFVGGVALFWIIWFALKLIAIPILIVNITYLVTATQHHALGTFDYTWLIVSALGTILL